LLDHFNFEPSTVTVLESRDNRSRIAEQLERGVAYRQHTITPENLIETLDAHLGTGDLLIDLAWNIDLLELLSWCRQHDVRYLNTSVEVWDPYFDAAAISPLERTLYHRHMAMRRLIASWPDNAGPSAVVEHGANPGLVSHLSEARPERDCRGRPARRTLGQPLERD
jgi:homospermidine synthase